MESLPNFARSVRRKAILHLIVGITTQGVTTIKLTNLTLIQTSFAIDVVSLDTLHPSVGKTSNCIQHRLKQILTQQKDNG